MHPTYSRPALNSYFVSKNVIREVITLVVLMRAKALLTPYQRRIEEMAAA